jgi:hypothetical protein
MGAQSSTPLGQPGGGSANPQQTASANTNAAIQPYYVGGGPAAQTYGNMIGGYANQLSQYGQQSMAPAFQDMFSKYVATTNAAANQQSGQIGATLGSRGALYSSANLGQQSALREKTSTDLASQASQYQLQLEQARQNAQSVYNQGAGQVMSNQAGLAQGELGSREAAMARTYQDYMRQSQIPPYASAAQQWGANQPGAGSYAH